MSLVAESQHVVQARKAPLSHVVWVMQTHCRVPLLARNPRKRLGPARVTCRQPLVAVAARSQAWRGDARSG
jgi:hypothetical protein